MSSFESASVSVSAFAHATDHTRMIRAPKAAATATATATAAATDLPSQPPRANGQPLQRRRMRPRHGHAFTAPLRVEGSLSPLSRSCLLSSLQVAPRTSVPAARRGGRRCCSASVSCLSAILAAAAAVAIAVATSAAAVSAAAVVVPAGDDTGTGTGTGTGTDTDTDANVASTSFSNSLPYDGRTLLRYGDRTNIAGNAPVGYVERDGGRYDDYGHWIDSWAGTGNGIEGRSTTAGAGGGGAGGVGDKDGNNVGGIDFGSGMNVRVYSAGDLMTTPGVRGATPPAHWPAERKRRWWVYHKKIMSRRRRKRQKKTKQAGGNGGGEGAEQRARGGGVEAPDGGGGGGGGGGGNNRGQQQQPSFGTTNLEIILVQPAQTKYETFDVEIEVLCAMNPDGTLTPDQRVRLESGLLDYLRAEELCDETDDAEYEYVSLSDYFDSECCRDPNAGGRNTCFHDDARKEGGGGGGKRNLQTSSFNKIKGRTTARKSKARLQRKYKCRMCPQLQMNMVYSDESLIADRRRGRGRRLLHTKEGESDKKTETKAIDIDGNIYTTNPNTDAFGDTNTRTNANADADADATNSRALQNRDEDNNNDDVIDISTSGGCAPPLVDFLRARGLNAVRTAEVTAIYPHDCSTPTSEACSSTEGFCCTAPGCYCSAVNVDAGMCRRYGCVLPAPPAADDGRSYRLDPRDNACCVKSGMGPFPSFVLPFPDACSLGGGGGGTSPSPCGNDMCALQPNVDTGVSPGDYILELDVELANVCSPGAVMNESIKIGLGEDLRGFLAQLIKGGECGSSIALPRRVEGGQCTVVGFEDGRDNGCGGSYRNENGVPASLVRLECVVRCDDGYCMIRPEKPLGPFCWGDDNCPGRIRRI